MWLRTLFQAGVLFLSMNGVLGTSVRPLNLVEMVGLADRVFLGRCFSVRPQADGPHGLPVVEYRFRVERGIKGVGDGQDVIVQQMQTGGQAQTGLSAIPQYRKGARLLLFLHGDSSVGLTSPVGLGQGIFQIVGDEGNQRVVNGLGNNNLSYRLERQAAGDPSLTGQEWSVIQGGQPIPIETFVQLVRNIDRQQKGRRLR